MRYFNHKEKLIKDSIIKSLIISAGFFLAGLIGILTYPERVLEEIILGNPLPKYYFPLFLILGLIVPLILRAKYKSNSELKLGLDPYFILLFTQIINEIIYSIFIGRSVSIIIGFVFTLVRIEQLFKILSNVSIRRIRGFFIFILILWSINLLSIIFNRLVHLF